MTEVPVPDTDLVPVFALVWCMCLVSLVVHRGPWGVGSTAVTVLLIALPLLLRRTFYVWVGVKEA